MYIINSKNDIETYIVNCHFDFVTHGIDNILVDTIQNANHPPYGTDWEIWLNDNITALRHEVAI